MSGFFRRFLGLEPVTSGPLKTRAEIAKERRNAETDVRRPGGTSQHPTDDTAAEVRAGERTSSAADAEARGAVSEVTELPGEGFPLPDVDPIIEDPHAALMAGVEATQHHVLMAEFEVVNQARADFACTACGETFQNLPVKSKRCPLCGKVRPFRKLVNGVMVSTKGRRIAQFIDTSLQPAFDDKYKSAAIRKDYEAATARSVDEALATASPQQREQAARSGVTPRMLPTTVMPAAAAHAAIDPAARAASREISVPLLRRTVQPVWHQGGRHAAPTQGVIR